MSYCESSRECEAVKRVALQREEMLRDTIKTIQKYAAPDGNMSYNDRISNLNRIYEITRTVLIP